jgi:hypothetical protein
MSFMVKYAFIRHYAFIHDIFLEVYRTREKPSPVSSASLASKAFLEKMNALFNQVRPGSV